LKTQDEERRRIARELHDSARQILAALSMNLTPLANESSAGGPHSVEVVKESLGLIGELTMEVRTISHLHRKRLTNTPVRRGVSVFKWLDERRAEGFSTQTTYTRGSSGIGGGIHEWRYAAERVLPKSGFEIRHAESASEEAALEEEEQSSFFGRPVGAGRVGRQEIAEAARTELRAGRGAAGRAPDRGTP